MAEFTSIKKRAEFVKLKTTGTVIRKPYFLFVYSKDPKVDMLNLGITVTKRVGCAAVRNKIKRRIKSIFRELETPLPCVTCNIIPSYKAYTCEFLKLKRCVESCLKSL